MTIILKPHEHRVIQAIMAGNHTSRDIRAYLKLNNRPSNVLKSLTQRGFLQVTGRQVDFVQESFGLSHQIYSNYYEYTGKNYKVERKAYMARRDKRLQTLGRKTTNGNNAGKGNR